MIQPAPPFTLAGLRAGFIGGAVLAPGIVMFGVAFGILGGAVGLSTAGTALFSAIVNAGSAQLATLQAWSDPVPLLAVFLTTFAMNTRYLLLGAALRPWFEGLPPHKSYPTLFVLGDGNWALTLREFEAGRRDNRVPARQRAPGLARLGRRDRPRPCRRPTARAPRALRHRFHAGGVLRHHGGRAARMARAGDGRRTDAHDRERLRQRGRRRRGGCARPPVHRMKRREYLLLGMP